jgi:hypothetical protein
VFLNNRFTDLSQKGITDDSINVTRVVVIDTDAFFHTLQMLGCPITCHASTQESRGIVLPICGFGCRME